MARLGLGQHIGHPQARFGLLHPARQFQPGQRRPGTGLIGTAGIKQLRIEPGVEFVVPGDQRPGGTGDEQEHGNGKAEPAVEKNEQCAHEVSGADWAGG